MLGMKDSAAKSCVLSAKILFWAGVIKSRTHNLVETIQQKSTFFWDITLYKLQQEQ
jgi:hypothetical protein